MAFQLISAREARKPDGIIGSMLLLIFGMIEITEKVICRELSILPYEFLDHYIEKLPKSRRLYPLLQPWRSQYARRQEDVRYRGWMF